MAENKCKTMKDLQEKFGDEFSFSKSGFGENIAIHIIWIIGQMKSFVGTATSPEEAEQIAEDYLNYAGSGDN